MGISGFLAFRQPSNRARLQKKGGDSLQLDCPLP